MGITWTLDQKKVIELRNRNILVSAAAGSGKTAVLVERIMERICDEKHPVDVDRLLVVTFTKAAAAEMKERVGTAIRKRLEIQPNNGYLQRQETLVSHAQITTIDSFCSYILRNHFGEIDLDPSFRVADEGELKLLKKDTLKELLEEEYEKKRPEFLHFVECYASGKNDDVLEELILKLFEFSTSDPYPEEWLENLKDLRGKMDEEVLLGHVKKIVESLLEENKQAIELCNSPGGPKLYEEALQADWILLKQSLECGDYKSCSDVIRGRSFQALSRKKMPPETMEEKKDTVKNVRNRMKKALENLEKQFFYVPLEEIEKIEEMSVLAKNELIHLTLEFSHRFTQKKRKKNIVDFSDMEHLALQILVIKKDGICQPTDVAIGYSEYFEEIMIDEYQDSNLVQELILTSISRKALGGNNLFMVGDVKQSIYRFRQARPELFMEKYKTYSLEDSQNQRVNLSKNFRSRKEVLDAVNYLFERMMIKDLGNVSYDSEAALYQGASMPEPERENDMEPELLLLDLPEEEGEEKIRKEELEASMIAERIRQMLHGFQVTDKITGELRPVKLGDIVILLRSMTGWSDIISNVLSSYGIPAITGASTGYFSTLEVQTVLNYLKVLNNRKQDIPLTAVLHSPIANLDSSELAKIRAAYPQIPYFEACVRYAEEGADEGLKRKLKEFWSLTEELRRKAEYLPIHKLLWEIYDKTFFLQMVQVQPNGQARRKNLEMLVQKALDFEATSYHGLFHFVRYIENLQKYEVDYGVAEDDAGNENAVRIMSIHKSKGLEFPIVFVAGLGRKFNKQDVRERIAMHPVLGLGIDAIDPKRRIRIPTLHKKMIQKQIELEGLGEELRVFYVALTRAKEKLIMTAGMKNAEDGCRSIIEEKDFCQRGRYEVLTAGGSYLDWILQTALDGNVPFAIRIVSLENLMMDKLVQSVEDTLDYEAFRAREETVPDVIKERFEYEYPYSNEERIPGKVSVSELKMEAMEEETLELLETPEMIPYIPVFLREERKGSAAQRGTAYHRVMECMDLSGIKHSNQVKERIEKLVWEGKITSEAAETVNPYDIYLFCQTSLCQRLLEAEARGNLYREQPFVIARAANEISPEYSSDRDVLIQGIMDAYFEEGDGLVLLDYKTDHIKTEQELILRYRTQIEIYAQALEQMTGKKVKEKGMYSFCLGREIYV